VVGADVPGAWPDEPVAGLVLVKVGDPPAHAADGEDWRVAVDRDAELVVDRPGVELDVGREVLLGEPELLGEVLLDGDGVLVPGPVAGLVGGRSLRSARIFAPSCETARRESLGGLASGASGGLVGASSDGERCEP